MRCALLFSSFSLSFASCLLEGHVDEMSSLAAVLSQDDGGRDSSITGQSGAESPGAGIAVDPVVAKELLPANVLYTCKMCRRVVFNEGDVESHEAAQQSFHRRKLKGAASKGVCSSVFLAELLPWMEKQAGGVEGKLSCPNASCGARLGSLKWTGAQCSCGSWVTPAIQFSKKNLDVRSAIPVGAPPGTVVHASLLEARVGPTGARRGGRDTDADGEDTAARDRRDEQTVVAAAVKKREVDGGDGAT